MLAPTHRRKVILDVKCRIRLLPPFRSYEEGRDYYRLCPYLDGEHGIATGSFLRPRNEMDTIRHYLDLKLARLIHHWAPPPEFVYSELVTHDDEERATLDRFNAWPLERE